MGLDPLQLGLRRRGVWWCVHLLWWSRWVVGVGWGCVGPLLVVLVGVRRCRGLGSRWLWGRLVNVCR